MPLAAVIAHFMFDIDWPTFFAPSIVVEIDGGVNLVVDGNTVITVDGGPVLVVDNE